MGKREEAGGRKGGKRKQSWDTAGGKAKNKISELGAGEMVKKGVLLSRLPKITQNAFEWTLKLLH